MSRFLLKLGVVLAVVFGVASQSWGQTSCTRIDTGQDPMTATTQVTIQSSEGNVNNPPDYHYSTMLAHSVSAAVIYTPDLLAEGDAMGTAECPTVQGYPAQVPQVETMQSVKGNGVVTTFQRYVWATITSNASSAGNTTWRANNGGTLDEKLYLVAGGSDSGNAGLQTGFLNAACWNSFVQAIWDGSGFMVTGQLATRDGPPQGLWEYHVGGINGLYNGKERIDPGQVFGLSASGTLQCVARCWNGSPGTSDWDSSASAWCTITQP